MLAAGLASQAAVGNGSRRAPVVKLPTGRWTGKTAQGKRITIYLSGKSVTLAAFQFKCGDTSTVGATNLNAIKLRKTPSGYRFYLRAHGSVTYLDGQPDENGAVRIAGQFSRLAKSLTGAIRVTTPRCGGTGRVGYRARRT